MNEVLKQKEQAAIEFLRSFERPEGYYLAFSGGKDSCVIKHLADKAGVKYRAVYRVTSVDPPELVAFIKKYHPDVEREIPRDSEGKPITMWNLIPKKGMLPTRIARYCCASLKEPGGDGMFAITGVRWAESVNRSKNQGRITLADKAAGKEFADNENFTETVRGGVVLTNDNSESRRQLESCYKRHKTLINPIIDWTDAEVWEYIRAENIPYCSLYDEGFHRLGCIGCPMARRNGIEKEFLRWPQYKKMYLHAIERMLKRREERGLPNADQYSSVEKCFSWWIQDINCEGQTTMFEDLNDE